MRGGVVSTSNLRLSLDAVSASPGECDGASEAITSVSYTHLCYAGYALCSGLLLILAQQRTHSVRPIYAVLILLGVVRSFNGTASRSILPQLVPDEHFANAVAWNATTFQAATILGPSLGGILYALFHGPSAVYAAAMLTAVGALVSTFRIKTRPQARRREPTTLKTILAGLHFIWSEKLILGAISLDLFAVDVYKRQV